MVDTSELAITAGYRSKENAGVTWIVGVTHASFAQNLEVTYNLAPQVVGNFQLSGTASNEMYGLTAGFEYQQEITDLWSFAEDANV